MAKQMPKPPELERDVRPHTCGEPQPWNWLHGCQMPPGHDPEKQPHRVNTGAHDIVWSSPDGPVETIPAKPIPAVKP